MHCLQTVQSLELQFSSHLPGSSDAAADSAVVSAIKLSVIGTLVLLSGKGHYYHHHKWHCVVTLEGQLEIVTVANNSVSVFDFSICRETLNFETHQLESITPDSLGAVVQCAVYSRFKEEESTIVDSHYFFWLLLFCHRLLLCPLCTRAQ